MVEIRSRTVRGVEHVDVVITDAEHAILDADGEAEIRRIVSTLTEGTIGLGRLVPRETDDEGNPAAGTEWFTSFPASDHRRGRTVEASTAAAEKLAEAVGWCCTEANRAKVRPLVADMRLAREIERSDDPDEKRQPPDVSAAKLAERFETARGRAQPGRS